MKNSTMLAKDLLESARRDGPSSAARSRIWEQVALTPSIALVAPLAAEAAHATSIAPAKATASIFGLSASKLLVLAGVVAVGVSAYVGLGARASHPVSPIPAVVVAPPVAARAAIQPAVGEGATANSGTSAVVTEIDDPPSGGAPALGHTIAARSQERAVHAKLARVEAAEPNQDVLMYEANLVTQARRALVEGRPAAALDVLDLAARDSSRSLEPEELSLRIRALKQLGRDAEATSVEETLRARYPDHFLSR
jgi:hypothetical protein